MLGKDVKRSTYKLGREFIKNGCVSLLPPSLIRFKVVDCAKSVAQFLCTVDPGVQSKPGTKTIKKSTDECTKKFQDVYTATVEPLFMASCGETIMQFWHTNVGPPIPPPKQKPCPSPINEVQRLNKPLLPGRYVDVEFRIPGQNEYITLLSGDHIVFVVNPRHGKTLVLDSWTPSGGWKQFQEIALPASLKKDSVTLRLYHGGHGRYEGYVDGKKEFEFMSLVHDTANGVGGCRTHIDKVSDVKTGKPIQ